MTTMQRKRARGFTMVELLIALMALGIGLTAVAPLFVQASRRAAAAADLGDISELAVRRMELLREADYGTLNNGGSLTSNTAGFFDAGDPDVTVRWTISTSGRLKTITVRAVTKRPVNGAVKMAEFRVMRTI